MATKTITVGISKQMSKKVSQTALRLAVQSAPYKTGRGVKGLGALVEEGKIGITIAPWAYYMYYQEVGIKPFTMWSLEGNCIPMNIGGKLVFRMAVGVGKPGRINKRDPKTGRIQPGNIGVKWRHPGLEPKNFIRDAMAKALRIHKKEIINDLRVGLARAIEEYMETPDYGAMYINEWSV